MPAALLAPPKEFLPCVTLIGMPGAGKSTVAQVLARVLDWAVVDTDYLIEAAYGVPLQCVTDAMTKDAFLDVEAAMVRSLRLQRTIIATGGSVVYREDAMRQLQALGPVVYLQVNFDLIAARIARKPDRGLAIAPGQTIRDIFDERQALYRRYAAHTIACDALSPQEVAQAILTAVPLPPPAPSAD